MLYDAEKLADLVSKL